MVRQRPYELDQRRQAPHPHTLFESPPLITIPDDRALDRESARGEQANGVDGVLYTLAGPESRYDGKAQGAVIAAPRMGVKPESAQVEPHWHELDPAGVTATRHCVVAAVHGVDEHDVCQLQAAPGFVLVADDPWSAFARVVIQGDAGLWVHGPNGPQSNCGAQIVYQAEVWRHRRQEERLCRVDDPFAKRQGTHERRPRATSASRHQLCGCSPEEFDADVAVPPGRYRVQSVRLKSAITRLPASPHVPKAKMESSCPSATVWPNCVSR